MLISFNIVTRTNTIILLFYINFIIIFRDFISRKK